MTNNAQFTHDTDTQRYTMRIGGNLIAAADYVVNGNTVSFTHTFTAPAQRGKGYAAQVVEFAMNEVETTTTHRVLPMCWYVADWFDAHPERRNLLVR